MGTRISNYIALLRAVNVGGSGKLPMAELRAMCEAEGFEDVRTYLASGDVVFSAKGGKASVKAALEKRLHGYAGRPVGVLLRTHAQLAEALSANPFPDSLPAKTVAVLLDKPPPPPATPSRPFGGGPTRKSGSAGARSMSPTPRESVAPSFAFLLRRLELPAP